MEKIPVGLVLRRIALLQTRKNADDDPIGPLLRLGDEAQMPFVQSAGRRHERNFHAGVAPNLEAVAQ
jgi:hypothetical protein